MGKHHEYGQQFPDELKPVVSRLLDKGAYTDPLELDLRKQRLMARINSRGGRRTYMRSRIATVLAVIGLVGGSGGAFALAGGGSGGGTGGPASGQYITRHHCRHIGEEWNRRKHRCDRGPDTRRDR